MQMGLIYGAGSIGVLVVVLLICYAATSGNATTASAKPYSAGPQDPESVIYQVDRATLLREAREKVYY